MLKSATDAEMVFAKSDLLTPLVMQILQSMKPGEITTSAVKAVYVQEIEPGFEFDLD